MSQTPLSDLDPKRWADEIQRFELQDQRNFPPRDAVLFVGSSSIALWLGAQRDFPFVDIIRRGFGGSIIADSTYYADRIVIPYAPRLIVFYAGDNDLAVGKTPEEVLADFQEFEQHVHSKLPSTHIAFVSIKFSPSRWHLKAEITHANQLLRAHCEATEYLSFVDLTPVLLGEDGKPRKELFIEDELHPSKAGYEAWRSVIAPFMKKHLGLA